MFCCIPYLYIYFTTFTFYDKSFCGFKKKNGCNRNYVTFLISSIGDIGMNYYLIEITIIFFVNLNLVYGFSILFL